MSKQKNAPQCLARYAGTQCRKDERRQCENSAKASNQFALLIAVNPFVIGCGNRGGKTKSSDKVKS
jgi:hypothetical protein